MSGTPGDCRNVNLGLIMPKDVEMWSFLSAIPGQRFPADRRRTHVDFGESKFGRWNDEPKVCQHYTGRRVDLLMRALPVPVNADRVSALRPYLAEARTGSAEFLAKKGVVLIDPSRSAGGDRLASVAITRPTPHT